MQILPTGDPSTWKLENVTQLVQNVVKLALALAGAMAIIYLILGAYGYFTAFGNEEKAAKAKTTITWAIIGLIVIILAEAIVMEVWNLFTAPVAIPLP